jgi:hypothetical protein
MTTDAWQALGGRSDTGLVARDRLIVALALIALAGAGALAVGNESSGPPSPRVAAPAAEAPVASEPPIAAAYRYPLGCLGQALSGMAAELDRTSPCWRYGTYVTVILRRVGRTWRMALEAVSPSCPALAIPSLVRAQVVVCRRGALPVR